MSKKCSKINSKKKFKKYNISECSSSGGQHVTGLHSTPQVATQPIHAGPCLQLKKITITNKQSLKKNCHLIQCQSECNEDVVSAAHSLLYFVLNESQMTKLNCKTLIKWYILKFKGKRF